MLSNGIVSIPEKVQTLGVEQRRVAMYSDDVGHALLSSTISTACFTLSLSFLASIVIFISIITLNRLLAKHLRACAELL